jgi:hypothetical protein
MELLMEIFIAPLDKSGFLTIIIASLLMVVVCSATFAEQSVWLSSLDLTKATQGFGKPQADKSVDGHPISLDGKVYDHGFGTHSPGLLIIDLNGGAKRFMATVGIDDEVQNGRGSAEFEVLGDGRKLLWRSGILRQGQVPKEVDIDLTGVKQIMLRVTTGGDGYEFDHADWADAQFIVTGNMPHTVSIPPLTKEEAIWMMPHRSAPHIHPPYVVGVRTGAPLIWTVPVSGNRPLHYTVKDLPHNLKLNAETGTITGVLEKAGNYPIHIQVKNRAGHDEHVVYVKAGETIALTPPMGWNSYDCFGDDVVESEVLANARYVSKYMQPFGWDTIVVDYRWYDPGASSAPNNTGARAGAELTMDAYGRLLPSPNRFPSAADGKGFKGLAEMIHAMGLKFGIHIMRGIPRNAVKANLPIEGSSFRAADAANTSDMCGWCPDMYGVRGDTPAGQAYYDSIFRLYASWGVDYVKMDDTSSPYHTDEISAVHNAILKSGRSIVYSLSPGETPIEDAAHVKTHANMWRVSGDFWDNWQSLSHEFELAMRWHDSMGPGYWPDADMLPLGHISISGRSVGLDRRTDFTKPEQVTLISLWSLLPSPLMVGANLPDNDPWTLALLTNPEVLAINQDESGSAAYRVSSNDETQIWAKHLADGSIAVGLFNLDDFDTSMSFKWAELGIKGKWKVRDLWLRKEMGTADNHISFSIPAHGARLLLLRK